MYICFDLDNTLFDTNGMEYDKSTPRIDMIKFVNSLYEQGHEIAIFTGRGSGSGIDFRRLTESQLDKVGLKYHRLIMGKPPYDVFIDDRSVRFMGQSPDEILREINEIAGE